VTAPPRRRRWGLRVLLVAVVTGLVVTGAALAVDLGTPRRASPPAGLHFVQAGDVHTRYRQWGDAGTPVVLVPGAVETADTFAPLGEVLGRTHRVYALDLTGTGYSTPVAPFDLAHYADQVLAFTAALGLTGRDAPVLVGHSLGAAVVGLAALQGGPDRVAGVMFLDGDAAPLPGISVARLLVVEPFRSAAVRLVLAADPVIRALYDSQCGPGCPPLSAAGLDQWRRPLEQPGAETAMWATLAHGIPALSAAQLAALRASPIPKAVAFGEQDPQYAPGTAAAVARRIGAPPPTMVPGRHLVMVSSPTQVAAAIDALVARTGARG